jgi:hypothetical protein
LLAAKKVDTIIIKQKTQNAMFTAKKVPPMIQNSSSACNTLHDGPRRVKIPVKDLCSKHIASA